jgi:hypothetical protein
MLGDIDLIFGWWVYNDELQIKLFCSGSMIFGPWTLKFSQIFRCHHFISLIWDIDLIFGLRVYSDKLQINFEIHSGWMISVQITAVGLWNLAKYLVVTILFHYALRYWLDFWYLELQWRVKFYRYRTSCSYASVVDSWSYQDLLRQYCFIE